MVNLPESVERVVAALREDILRTRYRSGERLPSERDLVAQLGVNRGAVREAMRVLAQLGLIVIGPGGARAAPLEDASLDVLGHMLMLEDLPDPELVDQVLEANGVLAAGWLRLLLDRGSDEKIAELRELLQRIANSDPDDAAGSNHLQELIDGLVDSTGNLVLRLIRRGIRLHFWDRVEAAGVEMGPRHEMIAPMARELDQALAERDGPRASEIVYSLTKLHREESVAMLREQRLRAASGKTPADADEAGPDTRARIGVGS